MGKGQQSTYVSGGDKQRRRWQAVAMGKQRLIRAGQQVVAPSSGGLGANNRFGAELNIQEQQRPIVCKDFLIASHVHFNSHVRFNFYGHVQFDFEEENKSWTEIHCFSGIYGVLCCCPQVYNNLLMKFIVFLRTIHSTYVGGMLTIHIKEVR